MEEERYAQEKKDEETEKRYRQDFDDWWGGPSIKKPLRSGETSVCD